MHLLYKDLQKYTNKGDALRRVLALMACVKRREEVGLYFTKPWQRVIPKAVHLSKLANATLKMTEDPLT